MSWPRDRRPSRRARRCSSRWTPRRSTSRPRSKLLSLPRVVGADKDGAEITAQNGRYGPYLRKGTDSRSLESEDQIFNITLEGAEAIFAQPKQRRGQAKPPLAELGTSPDTEKPMRVLDGRFGPYCTDGTTNATIPRGMDPAAITLEEAIELLRERAAKGPAKKKKAAKKKAVKKKAARRRPPRRRPAKKAAKKAAEAARASRASRRAIEPVDPPPSSSVTRVARASSLRSA